MVEYGLLLESSMKCTSTGWSTCRGNKKNISEKEGKGGEKDMGRRWEGGGGEEEVGRRSSGGGGKEGRRGGGLHTCDVCADEMDR